MARIAGIDLDREKRIEYALPKIKGIGLTTARRILTAAKVNFDTRVKDLTEADITHILTEIQNEGLKLEGDLRREIEANRKRLMDIGCYRGIRHRRNLPVRGQRTRTNARTVKGPRKTVGVKKKETK